MPLTNIKITFQSKHSKSLFSFKSIKPLSLEKSLNWLATTKPLSHFKIPNLSQIDQNLSQKTQTFSPSLCLWLQFGSSLQLRQHDGSLKTTTALRDGSLKSMTARRDGSLNTTSPLPSKHFLACLRCVRLISWISSLSPVAPRPWIPVLIITGIYYIFIFILKIKTFRFPIFTFNIGIQKLAFWLCW